MSSTKMIDFDLQRGERLLWSGQPRQGIMFRPQDVVLIPFSLLWGGFAIFWESGVVTSKAPGFFVLWGIPFVAVGLYLIAGRFLVDSAMRAKTYYGVTTDRIIIASGLMSSTVQSLDLRTLTGITLNQRTDGTGSILFGSAMMYAANSLFSRNYGGSPFGVWAGAGSGPLFDSIRDPRGVYEIITRAQQEARALPAAKPGA